MKINEKIENMKNLIFVLMFVLVPFNAYASGDEMAASGLGSMSCQRYLDSDQDIRFMAFSWVQGYLSSYNMYTAMQQGYYINLNSSLFDSSAQQSMLDSFCRKNPDKVIMSGSVAILSTLLKVAKLPFPK